MSRTLAVVVRRQDFQESSRIVQLVTREHGRLAFLAKGAHQAKSRFLGAIDLLHVVDARVKVRHGRGLQNLYEARVIQGNREFRRSPARRRLALHVCELVRLAMPEGRADPELFDVFHGALLLFARAEVERLGTVAAAVRLRILSCLGLLPDLTRCVRTGRELPARGHVVFVPELGGFAHANSATERTQAASGPSRAVAPRAAHAAQREGVTLGRRIEAELARDAARLSQARGGDLVAVQLPRQRLARLHELLDDWLPAQLEDRPRVEFPHAVLQLK